MEVDQICVQGTCPLGALKATIHIAANHNHTFSIMHIDVSCACFHAKAQRLVMVRLPLEDRMGIDVGKNWIIEKEHVRHAESSKQFGSVLAQNTSKVVDTSWSSARLTCFGMRSTEFRD